MREGTSKKEEKDRDFQVEEDFKKEKMKKGTNRKTIFFNFFFIKGLNRTQTQQQQQQK